MREAASFIASQSNADTPALGALLRKVIAPFRWWTRRRKLIQLRDLDDHVLEDIGVTRDDVRYAFSLPLAIDAALELHERAFLRSRRSRGSRWHYY
jgi:uncharacterized protein YjiS (DUF1127 family)